VLFAKVLEDGGEALGAQVKRVVVLVDRVANGAVEVARGRDGDDREKHLLRVGVARAAVVRAAVFFYGAMHGLGGDVGRDEREGVEVPGGGVAHEGALRSVLGAELLNPDLSGLQVDLRVDLALAH